MITYVWIRCHDEAHKNYFSFVIIFSVDLTYPSLSFDTDRFNTNLLRKICGKPYFFFGKDSGYNDIGILHKLGKRHNLRTLIII